MELISISEFNEQTRFGSIASVPNSSTAIFLTNHDPVYEHPKSSKQSRTRLYTVIVLFENATHFAGWALDREQFALAIRDDCNVGSNISLHGLLAAYGSER